MPEELKSRLLEILAGNPFLKLGEKLRTYRYCHLEDRPVRSSAAVRIAESEEHELPDPMRHFTYACVSGSCAALANEPNVKQEDHQDVAQDNRSSCEPSKKPTDVNGIANDSGAEPYWKSDEGGGSVDEGGGSADEGGGSIDEGDGVVELVGEFGGADRIRGERAASTCLGEERYCSRSFFKSFFCL